ncbi:2-polyprenyl-3-methyl-6-methoxy-1,4-benzoquinone monooxygenase [Aliikangiella coralliicola]|uniref:3-demethoxyubiquinol 3-hydroxylase n=1 Tax=Aliikangiella coralliicola TaxID=2592383 RepID=A0A545UH29_9GAMM|nr:2-polyprenyl-3-methyl-6-methoxy-1,4-benzoquinone monooxygenase [Aliikangiella coralliicola]TQV88777.1 2-polyprenyl-3-methyl-6-methoxy-1,4-benzoquinone monooxygenase [Aliikangiella coralliicola]
MRHLNLADKVIMLADNALKTLAGGYQTTPREKPVSQSDAGELTTEDAKHSAGLMRINHCGEVCAQALYQGQALTARLPEVREKMEQAAAEENDHLEWCAGRLKQLDSHTSWFNPVWYAGSFAIGAIAGAVGDKWSLGFVAETEHQVVRHLDDHLQKLPSNDHESRAILIQMREDELEHATAALAAGGAELPGPVKKMMGLMSKVMTSTVYYV